VDLEGLALLGLIEQERNLSLAARRLNVAVSTVSRRVDALEVSLGLRLVDRRSDGARLTPEGRRIAALAQPIIDQAAALRRTGQRKSANGLSSSRRRSSWCPISSLPPFRLCSPQTQV